MTRTRFLPLATLLCALAACAAPRATPTPNPAHVATAVPSSPTTAAARPADSPTDALPYTPVAAAATSSPLSTAVVTAATAAPGALALPTATPLFPTQAIDKSMLATLRPLRVLGAGKAQALALAPDGALLAAADESGAVRLFKTDDGASAGVLEVGSPIDRAAKLVSFSPDGALLGALRTDSVITVWRLDSGQSLAKLVAAPDARRLIFTADGQMAITGGPRGVAFYRLRDGVLLHTLPFATDDIAIGPRRRLLDLPAA